MTLDEKIDEINVKLAHIEVELENHLKHHEVYESRMFKILCIFIGVFLVEFIIPVTKFIISH